jgi:uncharacterized protein YecT (DUF1311 family)
MNKVFIFFFFLLSANNLLAQTQLGEKISKIPVTYEESETQLKEVYESVVNIVAKENKKILIKAQNDWLNYRESECKFQSSDLTDETEKVQSTKDCLFQLNKKRIQELMAS